VNVYKLVNATELDPVGAAAAKLERRGFTDADREGATVLPTTAGFYVMVAMRARPPARKGEE
jgi:hypothetical protein